MPLAQNILNTVWKFTRENAVLFLIGTIVVLLIIISTYEYQKELIQKGIEYYRERRVATIREREVEDRRRLEEERRLRKEEYATLLSRFFVKAIGEGYAKQNIKNMLIDKGWPKKLVAEYCDEFFEEQKKLITEIRKEIVKKRKLSREEIEKSLREIKKKEERTRKYLKKLEEELIRIDKKIAK